MSKSRRLLKGNADANILTIIRHDGFIYSKLNRIDLKHQIKNTAKKVFKLRNIYEIIVYMFCCI